MPVYPPPAAGGGGSGSVATDAIWDAKGDLAGGTGANTAARLAVGTNGHVLTADSAEATGLKWAAAAGGSANASNENDSTALVDATSTGDAGSRATHFPGTSLPAGWSQEATAPADSAVKYSSLGVRTTAATHYLRAYTPSGAFRVEMRLRRLAGTFGGGILIRDSGTGDASGEGMLVSGDSPSLFSLDAGTYNARGASTTVIDQDWYWLALSRDGSNQWNAYISADRALWLAVGTANYSKTFTVAKGGLRIDTATVSIDLWDVVS